MDWRALSVFALIVGAAVGFATGWHMGSQQSMDATYRRGVEDGRNKVAESKYAAQVAASNAKIAEINRQIDLEKQKNDALARMEASVAPTPDTRRYGSRETAAVAPPPVATRPDDPRPSWSELEAQRAREVRDEQAARLRAEQQARAKQEMQENEYFYMAAGMYHRYGCPFLTEPLVRAKLKDARLASAPCGYCKPPR